MRKNYRKFFPFFFLFLVSIFIIIEMYFFLSKKNSFEKKETLTKIGERPRFVEMLPQEEGGGYEKISKEKFLKNLEEFEKQSEYFSENMKENFFYNPHYLHAFHGASIHFRTAIPVGESSVIVPILEIDHDRNEIIEFVSCKPFYCSCERKRFIFLCKFSQNRNVIPDNIYLTLKGFKGNVKRPQEIKVPIEKNILKSESEEEIGICVQSVVYFDEEKKGFLPDSLFKEWIEHNERIGINQIHIYTNNSLLVDAGTRVEIENKKIKVFFHDMLAPNYAPPGWRGSLHARGMQFWAQNDCLARARSAGLRWAYFSDFDEYAFPSFPNKHKNLLEAFEATIKEEPKEKKEEDLKENKVFMDTVVLKSYRFDMRYCTENPETKELPNIYKNAVDHGCLCFEDILHKYAARVGSRKGKEDPIPLSTHIDVLPSIHDLRGALVKKYTEPSPYAHYHHLKVYSNPIWSKESCKFVINKQDFIHGIIKVDSNWAIPKNTGGWKWHHHPQKKIK